MPYNIFNGPKGLRAGWRLLSYFALVFALGYVANKIAGVVSQGRQLDPGNTTDGIVYFSIVLCIISLAAWIMERIEGRALADYGLP